MKKKLLFAVIMLFALVQLFSAYAYDITENDYDINSEELIVSDEAEEVVAVLSSSEPIQTEAAAQTYTLFGSGRTGNRTYYRVNQNYDEASLQNGGYDLYADASSSTISRIRLGLSFKVNYPITERATLTVYAYDVDENTQASNNERDLIYLVDEFTGAKTQLDGYLHGMNEQWNTTTMFIDASLFTVGHSYHFELYESVKGWVVWVRTVSLSLTGGETLWSGEALQPGEAFTRITLERALDAGEYAATLHYECFSLADNTPLNGAKIKLTIQVR